MATKPARTPDTGAVVLVDGEFHPFEDAKAAVEFCKTDALQGKTAILYEPMRVYECVTKAEVTWSRGG